MSSAAKKQQGMFRGIYEFEDPSGTLLAAKVPHTGSADLYDGTVVVVRPNQCALFIYQGKIADVLLAGTHTLKTENLPLLSKISNWKLGFQSPLRCELIFLSGHRFTARRFGTSQPVLVQIPAIGTVPIRGFGQYSARLLHPQHFYMEVFGSRATYSIADLEDYIQGELIEHLPQALTLIHSIQDLSVNQDAVSKRLEELVEPTLRECGIGIDNIQIQSLLPPKEVMEAMDAKIAIQTIGNQKDYLLYKAAQSLSGAEAGKAGNDPMHMMMGLMLGKGLLGQEAAGKTVSGALANPDSESLSNLSCLGCNGVIASDEYRFCPHCGKARSK